MKHIGRLFISYMLFLGCAHGLSEGDKIAQELRRTTERLSEQQQALNKTLNRIADQQAATTKEIATIRHKDWWDKATTVLTFLVFLIYVFIFKEMCKQNKQAAGAHTFAALTSVHKRMADDRAYRIRRYLHSSDFLHDFKRAKEAVEEGKIDLYDAGNFSEEDRRKLDSHLKKQLMANVAGLHVTGRDFDPLEAIERTMLDFDIFAVPHNAGITAATEAAREYELVFRATWPRIKPFYLIQKQLRGKESAYKAQLVKLLRDLQIDRDPEDKHTLEAVWL